MINRDLLSLLQCPVTGQPLELDDDAQRLSTINQEIAAGRLGPASGEAQTTPVEAILRSADQSQVYPVCNGVFSLLPESALVKVNGQAGAPAPRSRQNEIQHKQMEQYSEVYEHFTGGEDGIARALQRVLHERYSEPFKGASVLDIGNGGTPPEVQLGSELAQVVERFIAVDKSPDMLTRSGAFGDLVLGDAFKLPFKTGSMDLVMVNNTIHHFGLSRGEDSVRKLDEFVSEALRVARKGVIGVELLVPAFGESVERMLTRLTGFMPTFVYSAGFYRRAFEQLDVQVVDFEVKSLSQLTSPWKIIPPVLDFTWLQVPTFLIPYSFMFFYIEK